MENNKNFSFKLLSYQELCDLKLHVINRCGEVNKDIALKNYSEYQYESFIKRCNITLKDIKKRGYNPTSHLIVAKCSDDNKYYLIEGQGRRGAIIIGTNKGDFTINEIPCMIFSNPMTYDEIGKEIIRHNTQKSQNPWKSNDIAFSSAKQFGGAIEDAYRFEMEYRERLSTPNKSYNARLMIYGTSKCSHLRDKECYMTMDDFRKDYKLFMDIYEYYVNNFGRKEKRNHFKSKIRTQSFAIIYESFFNKLYKLLNEKNLDPYIFLPKVNKAFCEESTKISIDDFNDLLSLNKNDKRGFMYFSRMHKVLMSVFTKGEISVRDFEEWQYGINKITKSVA